ncbi:hypothetical protein [Planctomicrobium sp. SH664]|uniref:hypothetical protein n=1 Tax=Planctomicrobium sp. SH664 TaxID=3448125 RepID=UPI003F5BBE40
MTIRYKCPKCASVLKIKDQLAGTDGKCPKCKTRFVVPQPQAESEAESDTESISATESQELTPAAATAKQHQEAPLPAPAAKPSKNGDDFDVDSFLMDDSAPGAKSTAGLAAPEAGPVKPPVDRFGRRQIVAPPPGPTGSIAPPAGATAAAAASANALEMISKAKGEAHGKPASLTERKARAPIDWAGTARQLTSHLPYIIGGVILIAGLYWLASRMFANELPTPQLAEVTGSLKVDGKELPNVLVVLTPLDVNGKSRKGKDIKLRDASGITDENGFYRVFYAGDIEGAPLGKVKIWVKPLSAADMMKVPFQYQNPNSDIREVREAGNEGKFNLDLSSK